MKSRLPPGNGAAVLLAATASLVQVMPVTLKLAESEHWPVFAGYRATKVEGHGGNFIFNALQQGPVLGVSARS